MSPLGERLRVERNTDEAASGCQVPPLLLQPLVENAVTHGIAHSVEGGIVRLEVARRDGTLSIAIENPRDAEVRPTRPGVGLQNVRRRIAAQFGDRGRLDARAGEHTFRVVFGLLDKEPADWSGRVTVAEGRIR